MEFINARQEGVAETTQVQQEQHPAMSNDEQIATAPTDPEALGMAALHGQVELDGPTKDPTVPNK